MITKAKFFRGSFDGGSGIDPRAAFFWRKSGGGTLTLPDARQLAPDIMLVLWNADTGSGLTLADNTGGTVVAMSASSVRLVALCDNSTQAGVWRTTAMVFG